MPAAPLLDAAALVARRGWADDDAAWRALAGLWGEGADGAAGPDDICARLAAQGLSCHQGPGTLALLRQLDRPLWLSLQLSGTEPSPVLLTGLASCWTRYANCCQWTRSGLEF